MADEAVDTPATPEPSGQPAEPTPEPAAEPEPTPEPTPTPEPQPRQLTPEEIEERAFQRTASWMGRREKEFGDSILRNVTQAIDNRLAEFGRTATPPASTLDPATFLENPEQALRSLVPKILHEEVNRHTKSEQSFNTELIRQAAGLMDSDALYQGDEGQKFGAEVVAEIQKNFGTVDKRLPPNVAAQLLVSNAALAVSRKKMGVRVNPLAGNRPATGIGTITAPAAPAVKPKPVKLSVEAQALKKRFGYTDEEIAKVFAEG
jgi:hypothetical protein